jgi:hypothetical protein
MWLVKITRNLEQEMIYLKRHQPSKILKEQRKSSNNLHRSEEDPNYLIN